MGPPELPEHFGRYRILKQTGEGGMGAVYLAEDTKLGRRVALKVPRLDHRRAVERFYREARAAAAFTHPHLCPVYDVGEIDGVHFLTMPFIKGEALSSLLARQGSLAEETAASIVLLIARALHEAHQAGVVHRDLKPANVMLNERGEPVVVDFGLAFQVGPTDSRLTPSGTILGTPAYMPPEQVGAPPEAIGPACDIYSLGVVLYEMLAGRPPFVGTCSEILRQTLTGAPAPLSAHRRGLDPRLEAICRKAMAKDPASRFHSMDAFAAALAACLDRNEQLSLPAVSSQSVRPPLAETTSVIIGDLDPARGWSTKIARAPDTHLAPRSSRGRALLLLGAAVLVLCLVSTLWLIHSGGEPGIPPPVPPLQAGQQWVGRFTFRAPITGTGDVRLTITQRQGESFHGEYATEGGRFVWRIEGTLRGEAIEWQLTGVIRQEFETGAAGKARVTGTLKGGILTAVYQDQNSMADMTLRPR